MTRVNDREAPPSPWGEVDYQVRVAPGVRWVSTPSHGGFLIGKEVAKELLSERARSLGEAFGPFLAYEEDCACNIVLYEHPEYAARAGLLGPQDEDSVRQQAEEALRYWVPAYFGGV